MSDIAHDSEHGTMRSYIVGFLLSLVFTFIPYYMVVNHTVAGTALLSTILGFAVLQMLVQVIFFLHLGRGPKPKWNLFFFVATVGIILVVVAGSIVIIHNLHYNMTPADQIKKLVNDEGIAQVSGQKTGACPEFHSNRQVTIKNGAVSPLHTTAHQCDTLTFLNKDTSTLTLSFITLGPYPHETYAGENELTIRKGQGTTITLSEIGTYRFYNQSQTTTAGDFTVKP